MTDNEIIKALKCCAVNNMDCINCTLNYVAYGCIGKLKTEALDLINCQKAEIKKLRELTTKSFDDFATEYDDNLKAEAIKEFAEKVKRKSFDHYFFNSDTPIAVVDVKDIDNLVKEMTEG